MHFISTRPLRLTAAGLSRPLLLRERWLHLTAALCILSWFYCLPADSKEPPPYAISGRVLDPAGKPAANLPVVLHDNEELSLKGKTSEDGEFEIGHESASSLTLEVQPPIRSGFASVRVENLPGRENRKVIVRLRPGFTVSGRVEHGGKGVKGVTVTVSAASRARSTNESGQSDSHNDKNHGGGAAITGRDGTFVLNLTAGPKKLTILTNTKEGKRSEMRRRLEREFVVEESMDLGDFSL